MVKPSLVNHIMIMIIIMLNNDMLNSSTGYNTVEQRHILGWPHSQGLDRYCDALLWLHGLMHKSSNQKPVFKYRMLLKTCVQQLIMLKIFL